MSRLKNRKKISAALLFLIFTACGDNPKVMISEVSIERYSGGLEIIVTEDGSRCAVISWTAVHCDWSDK